METEYYECYIRSEMDYETIDKQLKEYIRALTEAELDFDHLVNGEWNKEDGR